MDSARPTRPPRAIRNTLVFLAAFAATAALLRATLPDASGEVIDTKIHVFEQHKDRYDVVFLGSSRVYRGFVPELFDQACAREGVPVTSFNFGLLGARASEILEVLKELRRMHPARLRWVFVDPEPLNLLVRNERMLTRREIDWHDPGLTWDVMKLVWSSPIPLWERLGILWHHWNAFSYDILNVGRGEPLARRAVGRKWYIENLDEAVGVRRDGYRAHPESLAERAAAGVPAAVAELERFPQKVEALRHAKDPVADVSEEKLVFFRRIEEAVRALGAEPIFVVLPTVLRRHELARAYAHGHVTALLDYGDPNRYPELYTPEHRYDVGHANHAGAKLFTRALARDFVDLVKRSQAGSARGE